MSSTSLSRVSVRPWSWLIAVTLTPSLVWSQSASDLFNGRGFSPHREFFSELPFEHIDPLTGNLLLTFTDLELPGNGGFNLKIQRTYNSKIYATYSCNTVPPNPPSGCQTSPIEDSWAGLGWTLHFGRVINPTSTSPGPVIEMADGSRHQAYRHVDLNVNHFMTRDYWTYDRSNPNAPVLRLPNGITYTFGTQRGGYQYATEIKDPFGNKIAVFYATGLVAHDVIQRVEQQLVGGPTRTVTFTYSDTIGGVDADSLLEIIYAPPGLPVRKWTFTQTRILNLSVGYTRLDNVQPPEGATWDLTYEATNHPKNPSILKSVKTANGGTVEYLYRPQHFQLGSSVLFSPAIETRTVKDRGGAVIGTWTHAYSAVPTPPQTLTTKIMSPCGSRTEHTFLGLGPVANERPWAIGVLDTKAVFESGAPTGGVELEREKLAWLRSTRISDDPESGSSLDTHVPLLETRTITRGGKTYQTTYTYDASAYSASRASNFNDFGRPKETLENGEAGAHTRKTTRTFFYFPTNADASFGTYIVDKVDTEKLYVPSGSAVPFERSYTYETTGGYRGFRTSETVHQITTTYAPQLVAGVRTGNVGSSTSARGFTTDYGYTNGVLASVKTPEDPAGTPGLNRAINPDGTILSETRRIFTGMQVEPATTSFEYDKLMRPTLRTPPLGNPTTTVYDPAGTFVRVSRGSHQLTTDLDGFGRPIGTADNEPGNPTRTRIGYDGCGRKSFESYPYKGLPATPPGTSFTFDALGRVTTKTDPGDEPGQPAAIVRYDYPSGVNVTLTDENNHVTVQTRFAFGDVTETRLVSVKDALQKTTSYTYNALGSLERVTHPPAEGSSGSTFQRTWTYYAPAEPGGRHGLLKTETHPESGSVTYTYDAAGNVATRIDANATETSFTYDRNDRLLTVDHPGTLYDKTLGYDPSDNRTSASNGFVVSTFPRDLAGRLKSRTDLVGGLSLTTGYQYDANDNLEILTYPSLAGTRRVKYEYDTVNRVKRVLDPDPPGTVYAQTFTWHPSGGVATFVAGNGLTHSFTYNGRYRLKTATPGGASVLSLAYTYEPNGNVKTITDQTPGHSGFNQTFTYDAVDRLTAVTGWNAGSFGLDEIGNRTSKTVGGSASYTYDPAKNRVSSISEGGPAYSLLYDDNGNLANDGRPYTYTPENMLETAAGSTYRYDADNSRKIKTDAFATRYFVHGPANQILSEFESTCPGQSQLVRDYLYAGSRLIGWVRPPGAVTVEFAAGGSSVSEGAGSQPLLVRLTTANQQPTVCPVQVEYRTTQGGSDYPGGSGVLQFPAGFPHGGTKPITIPIANDSLCGAGASLLVRLFSPAGAAVGSTNLHTITITEDDLVCVSGTKAVGGTFAPDGPITYAITLTNSGSHAQRDNPGPELVDVLPPQTTLGSATATGGSVVADVPSNTVTWNGAIAAGGSVTVTIAATIRPDAANQIITNRGDIHYDLHDVGTNTESGFTRDATAGGDTIFQVESGPISFYTLTPCRLVDTRNPVGPLGGPALQAGTTRVFAVTGACLIPPTAKALSLNVTAVGSSAAGFLRVNAAGIPAPLASTVNYAAGRTRGNNVVVHLNLSGELAVRCNQASGTVHAIIDVNGYFE